MLKKVASALILVALFCGTSFADIVYMTSAGSLGTIKTESSGDSAPSIQYNGNMSSPFLTSFWNGSGTSIMVVDRNAGVSYDRAYVFSPNSLNDYYLSADIKNLNGADGAGYSENGESIFFTAGAKVCNVDTALLSVQKSFDCTRVVSADGYDTDIDSIAVGTQTIHVIASAGILKRYIRFDGQLRDGVNLFKSADVPSGASIVLSTSTNVPLVGHDYGIDTMDTREKFYRLISTDYPVVAMCPDSSSGFFFATQYQSGDKYIDTVYHASQGTAFDPYTSESSSPNIKMMRDNNDTATFAVMTDEGIALFTYKDYLTTLREYSASELGGTPAGIAAATVSGYNGNSGSSGCNASGLGLVMIAGIAMFLVRRK